SFFFFHLMALMSKVHEISFSNRRRHTINQKNIKKRKYKDDDDEDDNKNQNNDLNLHQNVSSFLNIDKFPDSLYHSNNLFINQNKEKENNNNNVNNPSEDVIYTLDMLLNKYHQLMNEEFQ